MRTGIAAFVTVLLLAAGAAAQSPTNVSLLLPSPGATNVSNPVVLTWTGGDRATEFEVKIGTESYPNNIVARCPTSPGCNGARSYTAPLAPATKYYWRITARNSNGTKTSASRSFTTGVAPLPPPAESAVGTRVSTDTRVVTAAGNIYTFGAPSPTQPGFAVLLRNGADTGRVGRYIAYIDLSGVKTVVAMAPNNRCLRHTGVDWVDAGEFMPCEPGPASPPPVEVCGNGIDDDKDGQIDEGCAPPQVEFCSDRIDNDGDGMVDENCPALPTPACFTAALPTTLPASTTFVQFTPTVLDHYNDTQGYMLERVSSGGAVAVEDLGKPAVSVPLDPNLRDYRVLACSDWKASTALTSAPLGTYTIYVRACRAPRAGEASQPLGSYQWCSGRSGAVTYTKSTLGAALRLGAGGAGSEPAPVPPLVATAPSPMSMRVEFIRHAPGTRADGVRTTMTLPFVCSAEMEPKLDAEPYVMPDAVLVGLSGAIRCRSDARDRMRLLQPGRYRARILRPDGPNGTWSVLSNEVTVMK